MVRNICFKIKGCQYFWKQMQFELINDHLQPDDSRDLHSVQVTLDLWNPAPCSDGLETHTHTYAEPTGFKLIQKVFRGNKLLIYKLDMYIKLISKPK